ncbi:unnamed protein product [Prorocentrum cordatum]|uniref:Uncharacterized protein n=1 Tax=Prorocentrum cordatum TaxID=2364126 RepID=A0ABN9UXK8_9DINO|nr:unnamed protein product [Polarella glacialis]
MLQAAKNINQCRASFLLHRGANCICPPVPWTTSASGASWTPARKLGRPSARVIGGKPCHEAPRRTFRNNKPILRRSSVQIDVYCGLAASPRFSPASSSNLLKPAVVRCLNESVQCVTAVMLS